MRLAAWTTLAVAALLIALAGVAMAQGAPPCFRSLSAMSSQLAIKFGEQGFAKGVLPSGKAWVQFFAGPTGTWTLVRVSPDGVACIMATGDSFELEEVTTPTVPEMDG